VVEVVALLQRTVQTAVLVAVLVARPLARRWRVLAYRAKVLPVGLVSFSPATAAAAAVKVPLEVLLGAVLRVTAALALRHLLQELQLHAQAVAVAGLKAEPPEPAAQAAAATALLIQAFPALLTLAVVVVAVCP
jgi:hypothetical protein